MRILMLFALVLVFAVESLEPASGATCAADNKTRVAANGDCLVIQAYGESAARTTLIVFIHGDDYPSGSSDHLFPLARRYASKGIVAVGVIRPGYHDSAGNFSSGTDFGRKDGYGHEVIKTMAGAVKVLKDHYKADYVILAGTSGGSAISGVIIGQFPGLADVAILGACPCDVQYWRSRRGGDSYSSSLSPHDYVEDVAKGTKVFAITGSRDDNTFPELAEDYVRRLKENGIDAIFYEIYGGGHSQTLRSAQFAKIMYKLLQGRSYGKLDWQKEPSEKEKVRLAVSRLNEPFVNALSRYQAAKDCMARDRKDAENTIREMLAVYRGVRESAPAAAKDILRTSLDKYFLIADVALVKKCPDVADDQYRAVKRLLQKADLPKYDMRLTAAMEELKKAGK